MLETLKVHDRIITSVLVSAFPHNSFFDLFFSFLSFQGITVFVWIIFLIFLVLSKQKRDPWFFFYFLGSLALTFALTSLGKLLFQRVRPLPEEYLLGACPTDFSFPSGHASIAFAAATMLAHFDKKRWWLYFVLAVLIAYSRIYLGCHFFLDTIGGALLGSVTSLFLIALFLRHNKRRV